MQPFKRYAAEYLGTFALVFAGTGAIVINDLSGGASTHIGMALTFGLIVLTMIYALGDASGAHLNPSVTLCFFAARRIPGRGILPYVGAEILRRARWLRRSSPASSRTCGSISPRR